MAEVRCLLWSLVLMLALWQLKPVCCRVPLFKAEGKDRIPGQYIVVLKANIDTDAVADILMDPIDEKSDDGHILHKYRKLNGFASRMSDKMLSKLRDSDMVAYVEEDKMFYSTSLESQWNLDRIDQRDLPLDGASEFTSLGDGTNVHIYVVDSGINYSHQDFTNRTGDGFNFISNSAEVGEDCLGHGSHTSSIAAGSTYGVAKNAIIHDVRILDCFNRAPESLFLAAIEWIAENHIKPAVASMSLGGPFSPAANDEVQKLIDAGVVVVTGAGNDATDACGTSPGSAPAAINVGATDSDDTKTWWSNFGRCIDIFAPGLQIPSALNVGNDGTFVGSGTSSSCPHVSGGAAILLGIDPTLTPQEVTNMLLRGATQNRVKDARFLSPNRLLYVGVETCMTRCGLSVDESRSCQCDEKCSSRGDCCEDYTNLCWKNAPTCLDRCDDMAVDMTYPCQCDEACFGRADCCQDYAIQCKPNLPCDSTYAYIGSFYSPYYPDTYVNNQRCQILFKTPFDLNDKRVPVLRFDDFNMEPSVNCSSDNLTIYDGDDVTKPLLGKYCGTDIPGYITPSGPNVTIVLNTDASGTSTGYHYKVAFRKVSEYSYPMEGPGYITSRNFPEDYDNSELIFTYISASPGEQIVLDFTHFDIEGFLHPAKNVPICFDYLAIYDADSPKRDKLLGRTCTVSHGLNNTATFSPLKSSGSSLLLVFDGDSRGNRMGYNAMVTFVKSCNSTVSRQGAIFSSNYPSVYFNNERCYTKIRATRGKQAVITFTDFEVEEEKGGSCKDYLKVYDGAFPVESTLIGVFCGSSAPPIRSTGRNLLLEFVSDFEHSQRGFTADITFVQAVTARLVDGETPSEGRVEIEHNKYGKGSICDNNWDIKDASVVCKMLGYGAAKHAPGRAYFGQGSGRVLLSQMDCSGAEFNIDQCQYGGWNKRPCSHRQDASAICYEKGDVPLAVRLVDGIIPNAGRVELRIGNKWGTICGNSWSIKEADVVCRSLGYPGAEKTLEQGKVTPGEPTLSIFFNDVECDGDEAGVEFCRHDGVGNHDCDHSHDVGVQCIAD